MPEKQGKLVFVYCDDWEGLYVGGKLRLERHSLTVPEVLTILGVEYEYREVDETWLEERVILPTDLSDVKEV